MQYVNARLEDMIGVKIKMTSDRRGLYQLAHTFDLGEILKHQSICVDLAHKAFEDQAAHQEDFVSLLRS
jgi:hypothetical protein